MKIIHYGGNINMLKEEYICIYIENKPSDGRSRYRKRQLPASHSVQFRNIKTSTLMEAFFLAVLCYLCYLHLYSIITYGMFDISRGIRFISGVIKVSIPK